MVNPNQKQKVLVLLSGGLDSTACIKYYIENGFNVESLFINFGQLSSEKESRAVKQISNYYGIKSHLLNVKGYPSFQKGLIQGRNLYLISSALMLAKKKHVMIALGIHAGTNYMDCSADFVKQANKLLGMYTGGSLVLGTPFLNFSKPEIFEYCKIKEVPLELTYSCELGLKQPCNKCSSCKDLKKLYARQNYNPETSKRN